MIINMEGVMPGRKKKGDEKGKNRDAWKKPQKVKLEQTYDQIVAEARLVQSLTRLAENVRVDLYNNVSPHSRISPAS